jgi:hypothetical protein
MHVCIHLHAFAHTLANVCVCLCARHFSCARTHSYSLCTPVQSWQEQLPKAEGKKIFRRKAEVTGCDASLCQAWRCAHSHSESSVIFLSPSLSLPLGAADCFAHVCSCHVYHHTQGPNIADLKISCKVKIHSVPSVCVCVRARVLRARVQLLRVCTCCVCLCTCACVRIKPINLRHA